MSECVTFKIRCSREIGNYNGRMEDFGIVEWFACTKYQEVNFDSGSYFGGRAYSGCLAVGSYHFWELASFVNQFPIKSVTKHLH